MTLDYITSGALDQFRRITDHAWKNASGQDIVRIKHGYSRDGNRLYRKDMVIPNADELYSYDGINQIKSLDRGTLISNCTGITNSNFDEAWNFDETGNWFEYDRNGMIETRTHNKANEILNTVTHDANGNMTIMPRPNGTGNLNAVYDAWNRMVEVAGIAQYRYDGRNHRILKVIDGVETISFFNHGWQELESVTNSEVISYVWGLRYIDDLIYRQRGSEKLYSLADPNWNVVAICDVNGNVIERMRYDAFGKIAWLDVNFSTKNCSDSNWNRTFTGQVLDMETGLMLYRMRYYYAEFGRFVNNDPIGYDAGDVNLFRYCENIPVQSWDSYGYSRNGKRNKAPSVQCSIDPCVKVCNDNRLPGQLDKTACIEECFQMTVAFQDWYERNRDITWTKNLEPCPCNLKDRCKDKDKWTESTTELHGYHVGATSCIRSSTGITNVWKSGNQCCYDENGDLITSGSGQGSADRWRGPSITFPGHVVSDMEPADWATFLDGGRWGCHSKAYLNVRPQVKSDDCKGVPTPVQ
ncbi:MAG: hypothetical protein LBR26_16135 [Prevotella sp.]|nr:hypothetical protein [Prevotella sp.]